MAEYELCQMPIAMEHESHPFRIEIPHCPQNCQADHLIEIITDINKRFPPQIWILSQELCVFQCPQCTLTLNLSLSIHLHLQHRLQLL